jgi:23S rRNA (pseudouridine1915-N3)-methyltransferase
MKVIAVADSFAHFDASIAEFVKRLKWEVSLELLTPTKHSDPTYVVRTESERIRAYLDKSKQQVIYLDIGADTCTTEQFALRLTQLKNRSTPVILLVGGAFGVDRELLTPYIASTLSLSPMTLPHGLALLVLLEQLYRVISIEKGSKYHHA